MWCLVISPIKASAVSEIQPSEPTRSKSWQGRWGVTIKDTYWTLVQYDTVAIVDASDEMALTALGLAFGKAGNHRTQTLRAFSQAEVDAILSKVP
jgi:uncharacterized protein with GYD domain